MAEYDIGHQPKSPDDDKPYHAKRPHKKSRMGCQNCKSRRVKCDEKHPTCTTCMRRGEECVYANRREPTSFLEMSQELGHTRTATPSTTIGSTQYKEAVPLAVLQAPRPALADPNLIDKIAIWFFRTHTSSSFSIEGGTSKPTQELMRNEVLNHAFNCKFLFQSVMALSCLHYKSSTGYDLGGPMRKNYYQAGAMYEYKKAIEAADPKTFGALLGNSLLITAITAENFREPDGPDLYILHWLLIWRGIRVIVQRIQQDAFLSSGLARLFRRPSIDLQEAASYAPMKLKNLITAIHPQDPEFPHKTTYFKGLQYLGSLYQNLRKRGFGAVMTLRIITWFTFLPSNLVELFREKQKHALVILAHYVVFLKLAPHVWWLDGVGCRSLQDICVYLGPAWYGVLDVPMRTVVTKDPVAIARILLENPSWEPPRLPTDVWDETQEREVQQLSLVDDEGNPSLPC
ncbi:hypothetical protein QQS21_001126 [Conoideocrella luteorostrata]|uniref:Zn(2)-C6 fungal-type domain-containing protein n=1 Tax=Conoideocrella luteorostrata TaxID=1105319 RepID=A0AAJ0CXL0_9HYPO|nr:hypothetical protein QQS21_001126 [Conoideocrella luteorostrata]